MINLLCLFNWDKGYFRLVKIFQFIEEMSIMMSRVGKYEYL